MTLPEYADKYRTAIGALLRDVAATRGTHYCRNAYRVGAREALQSLGVERDDARAISDLLSREQVTRLGQLLDELAS